MKLRNKLLFIFILFFGIVIFHDSDCYAFESKENIPSTTFGYEQFYKYLPDNGNFFVFLMDNGNPDTYRLYVACDSEYSSNSFVFYDSSNTCLYSSSNISNYVGDDLTGFTPFARNSYLGMVFEINRTTQAFSIKYNWSEYYFEFGLSSQFSVLYSTNSVYFCREETNHIVVEYTNTNVDKLNLFELNLTDLDYNNQVHKFNIATYTNSPCYDELMDYYNNDYQYVIYLTDYERILTYQSYDDDDSFLYGSYVISGYIDYLITEKSFFYYSEYYNQVMSDSGNSVFNKDIGDYTKRFYFKLVYSEDSNDPHATIWSDNGNLFSIDYLESFEDRYFVGSSQTIYYAKEDTKGKFKDLTDSIYYLGYLNPTGGKTRDISEIPFYVYNFNFGGGSTELYVVNQTDYDYEEIIKSRYDTWEQYYDDWTILTDGSGGDSYIQGNDFTSSTFSKGEITDNTSTENDEKHIGEIRNASDDTNSIDKNKETESSISDGSIISNLIDIIKSKFGFSNNIVNNANEIKEYIVNTQETHKYYLNINHKYLSGNVCIIDLSWYAPYKPTVDAFICAFAYLAFIWHMFCKIPELIRGASATSYVSDIQAYNHTGFGRSSNIHKGGF